MQNFNILAGLYSLASLVWVSHDEKYARQDIPRQVHVRVRQEILIVLVYATTEGSVWSAHPHSLVRAFTARVH